jgi:hypothetical protein
MPSFASAATFGTLASSTSKRPISEAGFPERLEFEIRAAVTPVTRFAPVELFTARTPEVCKILEIMRVVVVLPLVPVIAADPKGSRAESFLRTCGSTRRATTPGTVEPPPVRSVRLASRAILAEAIAAKRRALSRVALTRVGL